MNTYLNPKPILDVNFQVKAINQVHIDKGEPMGLYDPTPIELYHLSFSQSQEVPLAF